MDDSTTLQLTAFNQIYKELEDIYHHYAKAYGLSDAALWILYSLWERQGEYSQRELCNDWSYSPQTVNSSLKGLAGQGILELELAPGSKKKKNVHFTAKGREWAEKVIAPLAQAEKEAFSELTKGERQVLLSLTEKYTNNLKANAEEALKD